MVALRQKTQARYNLQKRCLIFGNLALRNAWFAGGVEWNIGIRGHSHFTCFPLFTRKVIGELGHEILRMYEYEEINSWLTDGRDYYEIQAL